MTEALWGWRSHAARMSAAPLLCGMACSATSLALSLAWLTRRSELLWSAPISPLAAVHRVPAVCAMLRTE